MKSIINKTIHLSRTIKSGWGNAAMKSVVTTVAISAALLTICGTERAVAAEDERIGAALRNGAYLAPMATGVLVDDDSNLDDSVGGTLALGYRKGWYAIELAPSLVDLDGVDLSSIAANALVFPLTSLPNFFLTAGVSGSDYSDYPVPNDQVDFSTVNADAGLGYLWPLAIGEYDFAIRTEARYRVSRRERDFNDADIDVAAPNRFKHTLVSVGLQLPLGKRPLPPPEPEPLAVVEPPAVCADGADNDGDGLVDFPSDPGCVSADDDDELDPAQCSDGKDNDGDGLIDFPDDALGCESATDDDEADPCKEPAPGERISLKGCGTGDIVVLRGVNFEFDRSRLTAEAEAILDDVATELNTYPDIEVELSGHTDSRGSDTYNQSLSEKRAASVKRYLMDQGISGARMTSIGFGESQPVADNETDEGRQKNRRVELKITSGVAKPASASADGARGHGDDGDSEELYDASELGFEGPGA